jgi:hypothetical protein
LPFKIIKEKKKENAFMTKFPPISGWPGKYPTPDPKTKALLVLNDLQELKKDPKLASSQAWLSMFAKNALDLDHLMDQLHESEDFPKSLEAVNNWFKNAAENNETLSEILFTLKETHFRKVAMLQKFISQLVKKDSHGLDQLIHHLADYLKKAS